MQVEWTKEDTLSGYITCDRKWKLKKNERDEGMDW